MKTSFREDTTQEGKQPNEEVLEPDKEVLEPDTQVADTAEDTQAEDEKPAADDSKVANKELQQSVVYSQEQIEEQDILRKVALIFQDTSRMDYLITK